MTMGDVPEQVATPDGHRCPAHVQLPGATGPADRLAYCRLELGHAGSHEIAVGEPATPDGPRRWALPDDRAQAKAAIHRPLHDLNVRIVGLAVGDCHCNLIAEVVLDALTDATPAADGRDGDGRG